MKNSVTKTIKGYLVRDRTDWDECDMCYPYIMLYDRPTRDEEFGNWTAPMQRALMCDLQDNEFPYVKWEDEPREVEITIKLI